MTSKPPIQRPGGDSMDRRGNIQHFEGGIINVTGSLDALQDFGDKELDYIAGTEIISADEIDEGRGKIIIEARKHARQRVIAAAKKFGLEVT